MMATLGDVSPWITETPGERLFLHAYKHVRGALGEHDYGHSWMASSKGLGEFVRLSAAMELVHRCLNAGVSAVSTNPAASVESIRRDLRSNVELYEADTVLGPFAELTRLAAIAYVDRKLPDGRKNEVHKAEAEWCCWCGTHTSRKVKSDAHDRATVEHLWPEFLGGTSVAENLIIACKECNSARQHAFNWAWFGIQSCNEKLDSNNKLPRTLMLSLGLHRLMMVASGQTRLSRTATSLKSAAKILKGASPKVNLLPGRRYTFFEILSAAGE